MSAPPQGDIWPKPGEPRRCSVCHESHDPTRLCVDVAREAKKPRKRPEAELQKQADDFLGWDGWRALVTDPPRLRGLGVIEKGIPDRLYLRYQNEIPGLVHKLPRHAAILARGEQLWIEWKAKGGQHGVDQIRWRKAERARGALVWVAKEDFEPDYDSFVAFYRKSGLLRRAGL